MELLDRYLQAVGFWLPRNQKQDILAELSEDMRSQIEDREAELNRPLTELETAAFLKQRGRPMVVAGTYLPQRQLIGPVLFPIYVFVLKIVALCYLLPWFLVWLGILIFDRSQSAVHIPLDLHPIGTFWTLLWTLFGVVTFIFAMLDRASTRSKLLNDWDPIKLPKLKQKEDFKRRCNSLAGVVFGVLGLWWLLALPKFPFLLLGPAAYFLKPAPVWQSVYTLILILAIAGVAKDIFVLLRPQITWIDPVAKLVSSAFSLWIIKMLLPAQIYIVATNAQAVGAAAAINEIAPICLAGTAVGLVIAMAFYAWQTYQQLRHAGRAAIPHLA
jgi:hypothetical protein